MDYEATDVPGVMMPHAPGFTSLPTPQKASLIQMLAMKLGLMKPQLFPADIIQQPMSPMPVQARQSMWQSYAVPGAPAAAPAPAAPDNGYDEIEALTNRNQNIVDQLGPMGKKILDSPITTGDWW